MSEPRDPQWRERFIQMRKNCRAANKGAEVNAIIAKNLTNDVVTYRKEAYKNCAELARLKKENKSLRNVLKQEMVHGEKQELELNKLQSQLWKKR